MKFYSILNMRWTEVLCSEYFFKSNSRRRIIELNGKDVDDCISKDSCIIIMYDILNGKPLVLTEKFYNDDIPEDVLNSLESAIPEKFNYNIERGEDSHGEFIEIICVRKSLQDSLSDTDS